jgi:hypothetical protein
VKRFAAHYICLSSRRIFKNHYIELNDDDQLLACLPLCREIEALAFYNGILFLTKREVGYNPRRLLSELQQLQQQHPASSAFEVLELSGCLLQDDGAPAGVFRIDVPDLFAPGFSEKKGCREVYIQQIIPEI